EDWWDMDGEGSESSNVCLKDGINEIYNFYFDNIEEVAPEIDIRELEEKDQDQLYELLTPPGSTCVLDLSLTRVHLYHCTSFQKAAFKY
ncbi:3367_t:CDS:2, partial [Racocetra persica]